MAQPALRMDDRYTWNDYRTWPEGERWELIGGAAHTMAPSPSLDHQDISGELHGRMHPFFRGKKCRLFAAPIDVRLSDEDVVQPDLLVVCDSSQGERYVFWKGFSHEDVLTSPGFPDLRIELAGVFELALQQHAGELTVAKEGPARYKTGSNCNYGGGPPKSGTTNTVKHA